MGESWGSPSPFCPWLDTHRAGMTTAGCQWPKDPHSSALEAVHTNTHLYMYPPHPQLILHLSRHLPKPVWTHMLPWKGSSTSLPFPPLPPPKLAANSEVPAVPMLQPCSMSARQKQASDSSSARRACAWQRNKCAPEELSRSS